MRAGVGAAGGLGFGAASNWEKSSLPDLPARTSLMVPSRMDGEQLTFRSAFSTPSAAASAAIWFM